MKAAPLFSVPENAELAHEEIIAICDSRGVILQFHQASPTLDCFTVITGGKTFISLNSGIHHYHWRCLVARELGHIHLGHLKDEQSSLFLAEEQKQEAQMYANLVFSLSNYDTDRKAREAIEYIRRVAAK